jgi:opacity protein-like surface antigen
MKRTLIGAAVLAALAMPAAAQAQEELLPNVAGPCEPPVVNCVQQVIDDGQVLIDRGQAAIDELHAFVDHTLHRTYYLVERVVSNPCTALFGDPCPISTRG